MQVKKEWLEPDMGQQTGSTLRKDYVKLVTLLISLMQSTSCEMPSWMNHKLASRLPREMSTTSDMQMVTAAMKLKDVCSLEEKLWPT